MSSSASLLIEVQQGTLVLLSWPAELAKVRSHAVTERRNSMAIKPSTRVCSVYVLTCLGCNVLHCQAGTSAGSFRVCCQACVVRRVVSLTCKLVMRAQDPSQVLANLQPTAKSVSLLFPDVSIHEQEQSGPLTSAQQIGLAQTESVSWWCTLRRCMALLHDCVSTCTVQCVPHAASATLTKG